MGDLKSARPSAFDDLRTTTLRLTRWLSSIPTWIFAIAVIVLMLAKSGVNFTPIGEGGIERDVWPRPSGHIGGSSYGMRALVIYLGLNGFREISLLGALLTLLYFLLVVLTLVKLFAGTETKLALLLVLGSPPTIVALSYVGRFDILLLVGSWLVAASIWTKKPWLYGIPGILIMILGNPEHTLVAGLILMLLTVYAPMRPYRRIAAATMCTGLLVTAVLSFWAASLGIASRLSYWPTYLEMAWGNFFRNIPLVLYSGYLILWSVVIATILSSFGVRRILVLIALLGIPTIAVATTLDQTRVFVGVAALAMLSLTLTWLSQLREQPSRSNRSHSLLLIGSFCLLVLPAIEVDQSGLVRSPYAWLAYLQSVGIQWF